MATYSPRLKELYNKKIAMQLKKELGLDNVHQVPKLQKIVVSIGLGKQKDDKRFYEVARNTIVKVTGQAPVDRMARKSIAGFKIRAGMNRIGMSVTLRDARMYEFLDRFVNVALPRVRDFHGISRKAFDKSGNLNIGVIEQSIFPELTFEETQLAHGLQVTFVVSDGSQEKTLALMEKFGMPFEKQGGKK